MNLLVLGGTRFTGKKLVEHCLAERHHVSYVSRRALPGHARLQGYVGERTAVLPALDGLSFDWVIDFTGYRQADVEYALHAIGTHRYLFVSTAWADQLESGLRSFRDFETCYIRDKIEAEKYLETRSSAEMAVSVLRFPIILGNGDHSGRLDYLARRIFNGDPVTLVDGGAGDISLCWVDDAVALLARLIASEPERPFLSFSAIPKERVTLQSVVELMAECMGWRPKLLRATKQRLERDFPGFLEVDPFWGEKPYPPERPNAFEAAGMAPTSYREWLCKVLKDYRSGDNDLFSRTRTYPWMDDKYRAAERKWCATFEQ